MGDLMRQDAGEQYGLTEPSICMLWPRIRPRSKANDVALPPFSLGVTVMRSGHGSG